jgi:hypothetical protein
VLSQNRNLDTIKADVVGASTSSYSEPDDVAATFVEPEPPQSPTDSIDDVSMEDTAPILEEDSDSDPDGMEGIEGNESLFAIDPEAKSAGDGIDPVAVPNAFSPAATLVVLSNGFHPNSIAYLCYWFFTISVVPIRDLLRIALAQIWKGAYKLPSEVEISREIDKHHA